MKSFLSPFRAAHHRARLAALSLPLALAACNDTGWPDRDPVVVENVGADALVAWPPMDYALAGDPIVVEARGLKTVYACARVTAFGLTSADSASYVLRSAAARVEWPGVPECPLVSGKDTTLTISAPAAGLVLVLRAPRGAADTVLAITGTGATHSFLHAGSAVDTLSVHARFTFRDSTAGHPRRALYTDSLAACEVLQAAVYARVRGGDTLNVTYRTLLAAPSLPDDAFPACAGAHADTVEVVPNKYGYP